MAGLFTNRGNTQPLNEHQRLESKYSSAGSNLLIVIVFSLINTAMLVFNSTNYFLFSAFVPYFCVYMGKFMCGRFPAEYYEDLSEFVFLDQKVYIAAVIISAVILVLYLLCWLLSRNHRVGWLIFALVLFVIDTVAMFAINGFSIDSILDILFHIWVLYYLISGVYAHFKLKTLPPEETVSAEVEENGDQ